MFFSEFRFYDEKYIERKIPIFDSEKQYISYFIPNFKKLCETFSYEEKPLILCFSNKFYFNFPFIFPANTKVVFLGDFSDPHYKNINKPYMLELVDFNNVEILVFGPGFNALNIQKMNFKNIKTLLFNSDFMQPLFSSSEKTEKRWKNVETIVLTTCYKKKFPEVCETLEKWGKNVFFR